MRRLQLKDTRGYYSIFWSKLSSQASSLRRNRCLQTVCANDVPKFCRRGYSPFRPNLIDLNPLPGEESREATISSKPVKNKNAGLVGPAHSLSLICGELTDYVGCPRGSFCKPL